MDHIHEEIIRQIKSKYIDCPECESMDDQYQCTTCGGQGGDGLINIYEYVRSQGEILAEGAKILIHSSEDSNTLPFITIKKGLKIWKDKFKDDDFKEKRT